MLLLDVVQTAANVNFIITTITSSLLIYLLIFRSKKRLGSYKYLIIFYALIELMVAFVVMISKIAAHSIPDCFILFVQIGADQKKLGQFYIMQCVLLYAFMIGILAVHFLYRYFAVCHRSKLYYFEGVSLMHWVSFMFSLAVLITSLKYFFMGEFYEKTQLLRNEISINYNLKMEQIAYNGPLYYLDKFQYSSYATMLIISFFILISGSIMVYCGYKCHKELQTPGYKFSSDTLNIQKEMYTALIAQAAVPTILMYFPLESLFFLPMFGIKTGFYSNYAIGLATIFTSLDQIVMILVIKDFRIFFCCFCNVQCDQII
ncbi:unnamed protein product [Caenorhabditis angaria]|uniref:Seven TM Receptor n=1 Tax=Caenorhabditis angaria TaxID=860376 RepID=A0A9P1IWF1_9PELO|nr:unnamed protein product [Caenorhabditis angaria]